MGRTYLYQNYIEYPPPRPQALTLAYQYFKQKESLMRTSRNKLFDKVIIPWNNLDMSITGNEASDLIVFYSHVNCYDLRFSIFIVYYGLLREKIQKITKISLIQKICLLKLNFKGEMVYLAEVARISVEVNELRP